MYTSKGKILKRIEELEAALEQIKPAIDAFAGNSKEVIGEEAFNRMMFICDGALSIMIELETLRQKLRNDYGIHII